MNAARRMIVRDLVVDLKKVENEIDDLADAERGDFTDWSEEHLRTARSYVGEAIGSLEAAGDSRTQP